MDEKRINEQLDACLVKDYLDSPQRYMQMEDPFPGFKRLTKLFDSSRSQLIP